MYIAGIKILNVNDEEKLNVERDIPNYFKFGFTSIKSAILLNFVLNSKHWFGKRKARCTNDSYVGAIAGGGLFVKGSPKITINISNNIGIYFGNTYAMTNAIRSCHSFNYNELKTHVLNKLADELKVAWTYSKTSSNYLKIRRDWNSALDNSAYPKQYLDLDNIPVIKDESTNAEYIEYSEAEYRCLYEFLKNRNKEKTIAKYGQEAYDTMIGKPIEDQFVISALEVLQAEMKKVYSEYDSEYDRIAADFCKKIQAIKNEQQEEINNLIKIRDEKLKSLKNQIDEMQKLVC